MLQHRAGGPAPPAAGEAGGAGEGQGVLGESLFTNLNSAKTLFTIRQQAIGGFRPGSLFGNQIERLDSIGSEKL